MLETWMPPNSGIEPLRLFRTLAHHAGLTSRMRPIGAGILGHGLVDPAIREIVIHRTCGLCGAEYEWGVHAVAFGRPLGLTDEQLGSTVHGSADDDVWTEPQAAAFRLADELHTTSALSDELFAALERHYSVAEILELVVIAGWYHTIAFVIGAAAVEREEWAARFPETA